MDYITDDINLNQAYKVLNYVFTNQQEMKSKGSKLMYKNRNKFTLNKMTDKLSDVLENYLKDIPQEVSIKLPKLKKTTPTPKIKLPKLKKEAV